MFKLKNYQAKLSEAVEYTLIGCLDRNTVGEVIVVKGPTGTGKTPTLSNIISQTVRKYKGAVTFIFATPGQGELPEQAVEKIQEFIKSKVEVSLATESFFRSNQSLPENHVLVVGWQQIWATGKEGKQTSRFLRDNEFNSNLPIIVDKTKKKGVKIVLIIDESQLIAGSDNSRFLRNIVFQPDVTLETSATPLYWESANYKFEMMYKDAVKEGVVKKFAYINRFTRKSKINTEYLLSEALKTNRWLRRKLEKIESKVNPLAGIQIPNGKKGDLLRDQLIRLLAAEGITFENGKLAIWTDSDKRNLDGIRKNDSQVEVLIFKQAVAVGWDCPRAYVWINLRPTSNQVFSIQTCGRFLRMAELFHYEDEDLNCAYIFTDDSSYKISPDEMGYFVDSELAEKAFDTEETSFATKYESREGFYNDYESDLADPILVKKFKKHFELTDSIEKNKSILKSWGISLKPRVEQRKILKNKKVASEVLTQSGTIQPDEVANFIMEPEILNQKVKELLAQELVKAEMAPGRSGDRPRNSVLKVIQKYIEPTMTFGEFNKIMASPGNYKKIITPFVETLDQLKRLRKGKQKQIKTNNWTPADQQWYSTNTHSLKLGTSFYEKHLYQPYYSNKLDSPEEQLHLWLSENGFTSKIKWWLHNGKTKKRDLGIPYAWEGETKITFPDRLIYSNKGNHILLEVKHELDPDGLTTTKAKAEGIQKWIKTQRKVGKKISGGIVVQFKGKWMINTCSTYNWKKTLKGDLSDWEPLDQYLRKVM